MALNRFQIFILPLLINSGLGLIPSQNVLVASKCLAQELKTDENQKSMEDWMNAWMGNAKGFLGTLHVTRFKDPIYILDEPIGWEPEPEHTDLPKIEVPKGFVTDFASIPQIFWSILRPDGDYTYPAIIHDYLYWTQNLSREKSDLIFKLAMKEFGVDSTKIFVIYNAVRAGGNMAWNSNANLKSKGEKRILQKFPRDPRIEWKEWKDEPGVFSD